ncbi:MAG TPA: energy transducer TonB [Longimicrobiaceae bacterium]|nr:energy transducer TonB [Longimicrobiaceae bacterium]
MRATWRARADSATGVAAAALAPVKQAEAAVLERLHAQRASQTGATGHFMFDSVAPGEYALLSDTDSAYFFFAPVQITAGRQTRDLDNRSFFGVGLDKVSSTTETACTLAPKDADGDAGTEGRSDQQSPALINSTTVRDELVRRSPQAFRGMSASVLVRFRILEDGSVDPETVEAVGASVPESLRAEVEAAAEMVAESMRFRPAKVGGRPVRVWVTQPFSFR